MANFNATTAIDDVKKIRDQITELQDEKQFLETANPNKEDLISRFNAKVDSYADDADLVRRLFADVDIFTTGLRGLGDGIQGVNLSEMLCGLFGEEIKKNVAQRISALDYEAGPPNAERKSLIAKINAELDKLETKEERLIHQAESIGMNIPRRENVRPEIFLEFAAN